MNNDHTHRVQRQTHIAGMPAADEQIRITYKVAAPERRQTSGAAAAAAAAVHHARPRLPLAQQPG